MDDVLYINKINYKNFHYRVLNEYLFTAQSCWGFPKNSWLIESFNEKIGMLAENGLTDFLIWKYQDPQYLHIKEKKHGPRKLNISQLYGGFQVLFGGLSFSLLLFILEHISWKCKGIQKLIEVFM